MLRATLAGCLALLAGTGCSTVGSTLGVSPPQYPLLDEAKAFRTIYPAPDGPRELAKSLQPTYVVEPGDVLLVQPVELDAPIRLAADQTVLPDGTIDLGRFGRPVVAGKTVPQIEVEVQQLVTAGLKDKTEPVTVAVRLINRVSKVFYVLGEVNAPGAFPLSGRETALDAIVIAGGLTRKAKEDMIILSRPSTPESCRTVLPVCYPQIVQLGDTTTNYQLQAGDRIFVPSRGVLDDLFGRRKQGCPPCNAPQVSCFGNGVGTCPSDGCAK